MLPHHAALEQTIVLVEVAISPCECPENARELLEAITIAQRENFNTVASNVRQNRAFNGDSFAGGPQVFLVSIGGTQPAKSSELTVVFNRPCNLVGQ